MRPDYQQKAGFLSGFLYIIIYTVSRLPMPLLYGFSKITYLLVYYLFSYRKMVVVQNIARSFPEKKYAEIRLIVKEFYHSFCDNMAEILKAVSISPVQQSKKIELINLELIKNQIKMGKHVIATMGHCGNWEMLNTIPLKLNFAGYAVYKPLSTRFMDSLLLKIRSRFGMNLITDKNVVKHLITNRKPSVYFFIADQCPSVVDETTKFTLLHQQAHVFRGVEKLARKTNACVFYLHVVKATRGLYRVECKEISTNSSATENKEITQSYIRLLEQNIRENPSGWLWSHKRWKR